jgi:hypothetical protein
MASQGGHPAAYSGVKITPIEMCTASVGVTMPGIGWSTGRRPEGPRVGENTTGRHHNMQQLCRIAVLVRVQIAPQRNTPMLRLRQQLLLLSSVHAPLCTSPMVSLFSSHTTTAPPQQQQHPPGHADSSSSSSPQEAPGSDGSTRPGAPSTSGCRSSRLADSSSGSSGDAKFTSQTWQKVGAEYLASSPCRQDPRIPCHAQARHARHALPPPRMPYHTPAPADHVRAGQGPRAVQQERAGALKALRQGEPQWLRVPGAAHACGAANPCVPDATCPFRRGRIAADQPGHPRGRAQPPAVALQPARRPGHSTQCELRPPPPSPSLTRTHRTACCTAR